MQSPGRLQDLCLRIARYKKENKELLAFLLFESDDKNVFIDELRTELKEEFTILSSQNNLYYLKKSLRKILRQINRYSKYIDDKALELDLRLWFCRQVRDFDLPVQKSVQLKNLYESQVKKADLLLKGLHEDLREDYREEFSSLRLFI